MTIARIRSVPGPRTYAADVYRHEPRISQRPSAKSPRRPTATNPIADSQAVQANPRFNERGQQSRTAMDSNARRHPRWTTPFKAALLQLPATQKNPWINAKT